MIEVLGIDLRELLGLEARGDVAGRRRRRLGGVVPARERHDQDRAAEISRKLLDLQMVHARESTTPPGASEEG